MPDQRPDYRHFALHRTFAPYSWSHSCSANIADYEPRTHRNSDYLLLRSSVVTCPSSPDCHRSACVCNLSSTYPWNVWSEICEKRLFRYYLEMSCVEIFLRILHIIFQNFYVNFKFFRISVQLFKKFLRFLHMCKFWNILRFLTL